MSRRTKTMKQGTMEQEVALLWMHYTVIEKMTCTYADYFQNRACESSLRINSEDLQETMGMVPRAGTDDRESENEGSCP